MPTREQLETALVNADRAGDTNAARQLANAIKAGQFDQGVQDEPQAQPPREGSEISDMGGNIPDRDTGVLDTVRGAALDFMAGVNRGVIDLVDIPAEVINAATQLAGYDPKIPRLKDQPLIQEGTRGGFSDIPEVAQAAGLAGEFAAPGVSIGASRASGIVDVAADAAVPQGARAAQFADAQDLPLMTTDVAPPTTFAGKAAQSAAEKVPLAGTGTARAAQQEAREGIVEEFSKRFGQYDPEDVYKSLQAKKDTLSRAAGNRRREIVDQVADTVAVDNVIDSIDGEITRLTRSPTGELRKTADTATVEQLQRFRDDLLADPSFKNLEELRTAFRETVKGERTVLPGGVEAAVNRVYKAMTKDMDDAVRANLGEKALKRWKSANQIFFNEAQAIKKTRLKNILDKGEVTPEVIENMLFSNKPSEVKILFNSLGPAGKEAARAGVVARAYTKSQGSPTRFVNELKKMTAQTGTVFKGDDKKYVDGLTSYLDATREAAEASVRTKTGQELFQVGVPAAVAADVASTGGVATGAAGLFGVMARAYESKPVRNAMIRVANAKGEARDKAIEDAYKLISAVAAQNIGPEE